jgi:uncharacterized protein YbaA (DUF1428 family)
MARYVDGFVVPVPKKKLSEYRKMARKAGHGVARPRRSRVSRGVADDVKPGKYTSFPQSVKLKPSETVIFAWIVYKSRKDRDRINAAS